VVFTASLGGPHLDYILSGDSREFQVKMVVRPV
jgi:hypothetical protein